MTQDELVLKVSRLYEKKWGLYDTWLARTAIALVLEEAARVADDHVFGGSGVAAAIRAMKEGNH